ncbi:MAG TPA: hypothetical protein VIH37_01250, partial [Candidatus Limnocylindrales bacterium]
MRLHREPADHDPERSWREGARIFRCTTCDEEEVVLPPDLSGRASSNRREGSAARSPVVRAEGAACSQGKHPLGTATGLCHHRAHD